MSVKKISEIIATTLSSSSTDEELASAKAVYTETDKLKKRFATKLTSEDLDNIKTPGFYYAGGNNTVTNKPTGVDAFGLEVLQSANGWFTQILYSSNMHQKSYRRWFNETTWFPWAIENGYVGQYDYDMCCLLDWLTTHNITDYFYISDKGGDVIRCNNRGFTTVEGLKFLFMAVRNSPNGSTKVSSYLYYTKDNTAGTSYITDITAYGSPNGGNVTWITLYDVVRYSSRVVRTPYHMGAAWAEGQDFSTSITSADGTVTTISKNYSGVPNNVIQVIADLVFEQNKSLEEIQAMAACCTSALNSKADSEHTHTKSQITDFPSSLKNPNALTIKGNGTTLTNGTYDGSAAKTVNITASAIGAAGSTHAHSDYASKQNTAVTGTFTHGSRLSGSASGTSSFASGLNVTASAPYSHAEGQSTIASGAGNCHAEGYQTTASGANSHAEGQGTTASAISSHAEGYASNAAGKNSHAEGCDSTASGDYSHSEGYQTVASGVNSHAEGIWTEALANQHAQGHHNNTATATANSNSGTSDGTAFVIGNGTSDSKSNAFRVNGNGNVYATNATISTGADYAEYFEWHDGNLNAEDRVGFFVTFSENNPEKIRIATSEDNYILGIVSGMPSVIGNGDECWKQRYVLDDFGRYIEETFEYEDEEGNKKTGTKYKENADYDSSKEYTSRDQRVEWSAVGMLGVLSVRDDGTCEVNGYCRCGKDGIATASDTGYRVIKRVSDNVVKVVFR